MSTNRRLDPRPWQTNYLFLRSLAVQLRLQARRHLAPRSADILDIGCGARPYEDVFAPYARRYVGVDLYPGANADIVAAAEDLPIEDGSFDCVVCSQVLEHSEDPRAVVSEAHRVLRVGGLALFSTHGVIRYHPCPDDYWRWTHTGLRRLIEQAGQWRSIDVYPNGGTATALVFLTGRELDVLASHARLSRLVWPLQFFANVAGWNADRLARRVWPDRPPDLSPNYLVAAIRGDRTRTSAS